MSRILKFPFLIEHCIELAQWRFSRLFSEGPQDFNDLLKDREAWLEQASKQGDTLDKLSSTKQVFQDLGARSAFIMTVSSCQIELLMADWQVRRMKTRE